MTKSITVYNKEELDVYKENIVNNLEESVKQIEKIIREKESLEVFKDFKFEKIAREPLSGKRENLIEVINQSQTYLISILAVEYLFDKYPEQVFVLNWGNIPGYDIESVDGTIIAECFAATSYKSNGKLTADLKRLNANNTACIKYEFFYDKEFKEEQKQLYKEKYPTVTIVKFSKMF